jgi:hypothetical protein
MSDQLIPHNDYLDNQLKAWLKDIESKNLLCPKGFSLEKLNLYMKQYYYSKFTEEYYKYSYIEYPKTDTSNCEKIYCFSKFNSSDNKTVYYTYIFVDGKFIKRKWY